MPARTSVCAVDRSASVRLFTCWKKPRTGVNLPRGPARATRGALSTDTVPTAARGFVTIDTEGSKDGADPGRDETVPSDDRAVGRFSGRSNL